MNELYDDDEVQETEVTQEPSPSTKMGNVIDNELPVKWKEALTQIEYGFDYASSSIFLFGDIDGASLYDVIMRTRAILHMRDDASKNDPINLIINSDGGDVYEALGIIDYIHSLDIKVNTICRGRAMSAAALLLCAGTGIRAASKNSTIMFHEMSSGMYGKASDMKANAAHMVTLEDILVNIMSINSNKPPKFWKDTTIKDYYMTPVEALTLGVIDQIIEPKFSREIAK